MKLEELEVYQAAMEMAERVWSIVAKWEYFARDTLGKQLVRAADSVAAHFLRLPIRRLIDVRQYGLRWQSAASTPL